jgi:hypothetical protein
VPFEKGKSGNPNGRRKEKKFTQALSAALEAEDKVKLYQLRDKLIAQALAGESWAMKEVLERYEGKVPQGVVGEDEDSPVKVALEVSWKSPRPPAGSSTDE